MVGWLLVVAADRGGGGGCREMAVERERMNGGRKTKGSPSFGSPRKLASLKVTRE